MIELLNDFEIKVLEQKLNIKNLKYSKYINNKFFASYSFWMESKIENDKNFYHYKVNGYSYKVIEKSLETIMEMNEYEFKYHFEYIDSRLPKK